MPLQCIIDAYNIINHTAFTPIRKKIKDPKIALIDLIKKRIKGKSSRNKITIVFDGYPCALEKGQEEPGIESVFSREETADAVIKRMVETSKNPRDITVVSDDREIRFFIKSCGASPIAAEEFINPREKPQRKKEDLIKAELNYSQINSINQELKALWLKD